MFNSSAEEFAKIKTLNFKHFDDEKYNRVLDEPQPHRMEPDFNPEDCDIGLARDPTQGSDIERSARSEAILVESKDNQSINGREATLNWMDSIGVENPEVLVPEPQPDPMQEAMVKDMAMQAEFKNREMQLRERTIAKDEQKLKLESIRDMKKLGMDVEKVEAETLGEYVDMLTKIAKVEIEAQKAQQDGVIKGIDTITRIGEKMIGPQTKQPKEA